MSEAELVIQAASQLPLKDAAYDLWVKKRELDNLEQAPPVQPQPDVPYDWDATKKLLAKIEAQLVYERDNAHHGPTFDRLKRAHSEASDADLKDAIKAAVKLERDCTLRFADLEKAHWHHVESRRANVDFPEGYDRKYDYDYFVNQTYDFPEGWGFDWGHAISEAIELATAENPGFQEATYQDARHRLAFAMR